MKETSGEVSMTVVTLVAIALIGGLVAFMWPNIRGYINDMWQGSAANCPAGFQWDANQKKCV